MKKICFGITKDGQQASKYVLQNAKGMEVEVSDFGALVLAIRIPDNKGNVRDVVLGFDTMEEYYDISTGFGAYIGRNANRIEGANLVIDNIEYQLDVNNGKNNLHSGLDRSHCKLYQAVYGENEVESYVELSRTSPHMEQGFPGDLEQKICYTLTDKNEFIIDYEMTSNRTTVVNPTNHSYFNLNGHNRGNILAHELEIYSKEFLLTDEQLIPTGEIASVLGTPMDFTSKKEIGRDIEAAYEPLVVAGGYDHNYIFENDGKIKHFATFSSRESGIEMKVFSDMCGMQIYTGNFLDGEKGKEGAIYERHAGICFETQFYPNACKQPKFPTSILPAGKMFRSRTIYKFQ